MLGSGFAYDFTAEETNPTISFETNGGTPIDSITDKAGAPITMPEAPIKNGTTFDGWYTDVTLNTRFEA